MRLQLSACTCEMSCVYPPKRGHGAPWVAEHPRQPCSSEQRGDEQMQGRNGNKAARAPAMGLTRSSCRGVLRDAMGCSTALPDRLLIN